MDATEERTMCSYLVRARIGGESAEDDFIDLITGDLDEAAFEERLQLALRCRATRPLFNAVTSLSHHHDPAVFFQPLLDCFQDCSTEDTWSEIDGNAEADLRTTLDIIRAEVISAIGRVGIMSNDAVTFVAGVLDLDDDLLHFSAFKTLRQMGKSAASVVHKVEQYLHTLSGRELPPESIPLLRQEATAMIEAISQ